jgi:hypothetical protein
VLVNVLNFIVGVAMGAGIGHALTTAAETTVARWRENHRA